MDVQQVFETIYAENRWGGERGSFYSGTGSDEDFTSRYVQAVERYVRKHGIESIVDLGCGDFRVGSQIVERTGVSYTGVDVVRPLVTENNRKFGNGRVRFVCSDVTSGPLPPGELCLIRQVLQHLSNAQIASILSRLRSYSHVIVTEHVPLSPKAVNTDKLHGADVRLDNGSGVFLDQPPFSRSLEVLTETLASFAGMPAVITSWLLRDVNEPMEPGNRRPNSKYKVTSGYDQGQR